MKGKRRRLWEGCKTLLILLLSCSAVYLAGRTLFPQGHAGLLSRLPQSSAPPSQSNPSALVSQTLRPAAFAVTWEDGRYGLLYHQEDQETYTRLSSLLADALSGAGAPTQVAQRTWTQALAQPGFFCEYLGPIPLDALSRWLSGQENPALAGLAAQRLCVTAQTLYLQTGDGALRACPLSSSLADGLEQLTADLSPNGARFAGEVPEFRRLRGDSLVLSLTPSLPQLLTAQPISVSDGGVPGEVLAQLLQSLSFHPQTNPLYATPDGWAITDSGETLRVSASGRLTYRRAGEDSPRFPAEDFPLDAALALAEKTVGALGGDARLYLMDVRTQGSASVITYGYAYRGAAIQVEEEGWCAQFTVENGAVSAFVLKPRRYTLQEGSSAVLLPQEQAVAALPEGQGQTLLPLYADKGGAQELVPFWAARASGR